MLSRFPLVAACLLIASAMPAFGAEPDPPWQAGAAGVVITPAKFMWMSGYGARNKPAEGKISDLWAKALALQDPSGERLLLITLDLVGIDRGMSLAVCKELEDKYGLRREQIRLAASHTHSGPVVRSNLQTMYQLDAAQSNLVNDYAVELQAKLMTLAGEALRKLAPARLQWGIGHCSVAVNRRTNKENDVPSLRAAGKLAGPVDHDVPVLAAYDRKDRLLAVVFGYACHATVLNGYEWCADYPGFAQSALEKRYPGALALFWAGCGGDQNPLPRRSALLARQYGDQLADSDRGPGMHCLQRNQPSLQRIAEP
jgi:neutral ceramidase